MFKPEYYYLIPTQSDEHGLTHGYRTYITKRPGVEEFEQFSRGKEIKYDSYREGPPRLYEIPRFNSLIFPLLLVSENIKTFLSNFKLPEHQFFSKRLVHYKLHSETNFFLLQIKEDTLLDYLDWENVDFYYTLGQDQRSMEAKKQVQTKLSSKKDFLKESDRLKKELNVRSIYIYPTSFSQSEQFDMITYQDAKVSGKVILVPDYFKAAFEKHFPDQVTFKKVDNLDISVNEQAYLERKSFVEKIEFNSTPLEIEVEEEYLFYSAKMNRLSTQVVELPESYQGTDEFAEKERTLKKIFPPEFKAFIRSQKSLQNFQLNSIKDFYIEGNYQSSNPETYGAVIFAEDGSGEGIGLLLKKDSDVELDEQWYYFSHEDGNVFPLTDLSDYIE